MKILTLISAWARVGEGVGGIHVYVCACVFARARMNKFVREGVCLYLGVCLVMKMMVCVCVRASVCARAQRCVSRQ